MTRFLAIAGITLLAGFAVACGSVAGPEGWAAPVEQDSVLLAANHDRLTALSSESHDELWLFPPTEAEIRQPAALYGTPATDGTAAYVPTYDRDDRGSLHKLDLQTGNILWTFEAASPILASATYANGIVYVGDSDGLLHAIDGQSGEAVWDQAFEANDRIWAPPALNSGVLFVTSLDGNLYAIDADNGSRLWSFETSAGISVGPIVDSNAGVVYIAGLDSHIRAIDIESHEEVWSFKTSNALWSTPLLLGDALIAADTNGNVYALDTANGTNVWDQPFHSDDPIRAAVTSVGGMILVIDQGGLVSELGLDDGTANRELDIGSDVLADPLILGSELTVITAGGDLVQIDTGNLTETTRIPLPKG